MICQKSINAVTLKALILIFAFVQLVSGCKGSFKKTDQNLPPPSSPVAITEQVIEEDFNLMEHSALDTCGGVFAGEWDEKVNDKITVRVAVRVCLDEGRILGIEITDSSYLDVDAARVIPQRILEAQRLPVDAVSGASVGSWSIMTAVAQALKIDLIELEEQTDELVED